MDSRRLSLILFITGIIIFVVGTTAVSAQEEMTEADILARGEYIANIGACTACHTPPQEAYTVPPEDLTPEQLQQMVLFAVGTLDKENKLLAGGRAFDLGPAGVLISRNLTSDEATGLGAWTDDEIENAIRIGVSRDGRRLHPLMPYRNYYTMAEQDMTALIAYLRTVPAVENEIPTDGPSGEGIAPELLPSSELLDAPPDGSDIVELGGYLLNIMSCSDCHTPINSETGEPIADQFLAGGQPYEGPWGIVYAANITPHETTGIASWTDEELVRLMRTGVRKDNRQVVLMPWQDYTATTDSDLMAVIAYLREGVAPVENQVPAPAVNEEFLVFQEAPVTTAAPASDENTPIVIVILVVAVVILASGYIMSSRRKT